MITRSANDLLSADGLASLATRLSSEHALDRGGSVQRALADIGRGASLPSAVSRTAPTAKGFIAEHDQAHSYTSRAAALGKESWAEVNPVTNDPTHDVFVVGPHRPRQGKQLKTGKPATVRRAIRSKKYADLVVPTEHLDEVADLATTHGVMVSDRLECDAVSATPMSIVEYHELTTEFLTRTLLGEKLASALDKLVIAARAGANDALVNAAVALIGRVADDIFHGRPIHVAAAARAAIRQGAVAAARTSGQTLMLMSDLRVRAGRALSARVLRHAAAGATVVGAVADVVVATALDFIDVLRGKMSKDELLRRAGVHTLEAGGAAAGVLLAYYATRSAPWWISVLAGIAGGYVGGHVGRELGEELFMPTTFPSGALPLPAPYSTPKAR